MATSNISAHTQRQDFYDHSQYVSMTMEFRCNLKCVHCMIEDTMDRLQPQSDDEFQQLLDYNQRTRRWSGLILTGSEITLRKDLGQLATQARLHGFQHVRIQSHGMHLAQPSFCDQLVNAGIDEYFISVAGADAASHDLITTCDGSFARTLKGLEHLERYEHVISITNSVITAESYRLMPDIVRRLAHLNNLVQMEFWVYWPMSHTDDKNLVVKHQHMLPWLEEAIDLAEQLGRRVEVKNLPQCLLGKRHDRVVNAQPQLFIDSDFWQEFEKNGFYQCPHRQQCSAQDCLGLNTAYIDKFGHDEQLLRPLTEHHSPALAQD